MPACLNKRKKRISIRHNASKYPQFTINCIEVRSLNYCCYGVADVKA